MRMSISVRGMSVCTITNAPLLSFLLVENFATIKLFSCKSRYLGAVFTNLAIFFSRAPKLSTHRVLGGQLFPKSVYYFKGLGKISPAVSSAQPLIVKHNFWWTCWPFGRRPLHFARRLQHLANHPAHSPMLRADRTVKTHHQARRP